MGQPERNLGDMRNGTPISRDDGYGVLSLFLHHDNDQQQQQQKPHQQHQQAWRQPRQPPLLKSR
jgi:hypothetical protein